MNLANLLPGESTSLEARATLEGYLFADLKLDSADLTATAFVDCEFRNVSFIDVVLRSSHFQDSSLHGCLAPTFVAPRAGLRNLEVHASRIGALELYDGGVRSVLFEDCRLGWVNLRASTVEDVLFRNCTFDEIDLSSTKCKRVAFENCKAESVRFSQATLMDVDLRGLEMTEILDLSGMKGATISYEQTVDLAPQLAHAMGLRIEA